MSEANKNDSATQDNEELNTNELDQVVGGSGRGDSGAVSGLSTIASLTQNGITNTQTNLDGGAGGGANPMFTFPK